MKPSVDLRVHDVCFAHWRVAPERVAALLPSGAEPDVVDGAGHVGLLAMRCTDVRPLGLPAVPALSSYVQVNVRLYARGPDGRPAVVFRSLDVSSGVVAALGRVGTGLPWLWSSVRGSRDGRVSGYDVRRRRSGLRARLALRVGERTSGGPLERRLVEQQSALLRRAGRLLRWDDEHERWPLHRAEVVAVDDALVRAAGVPVADADPVSVLWSPGLAMRLTPAPG